MLSCGNSVSNRVYWFHLWPLIFRWGQSIIRMFSHWTQHTLQFAAAVSFHFKLAQSCDNNRYLQQTVRSVVSVSCSSVICFSSSFLFSTFTLSFFHCSSYFFLLFPLFFSSFLLSVCPSIRYFCTLFPFRFPVVVSVFLPFLIFFHYFFLYLFFFLPFCVLSIFLSFILFSLVH
jgi:hypothetical protein